MHCHLLKFIKVIYLSYCQFYQDSHHGKLYELKLNNFFIANIIWKIQILVEQQNERINIIIMYQAKVVNRHTHR